MPRQAAVSILGIILLMGFRAIFGDPRRLELGNLALRSWLYRRSQAPQKDAAAGPGHSLEGNEIKHTPLSASMRSEG